MRLVGHVIEGLVILVLQKDRDKNKLQLKIKEFEAISWKDYK